MPTDSQVAFAHLILNLSKVNGLWYATRQPITRSDPNERQVLLSLRLKSDSFPWALFATPRALQPHVVSSCRRQEKNPEVVPALERL